MVASVAALGMSLDLGRLYYTHRDLQLLADMAALDAARSAGGCMGKVEDRQGSAAGEAAASLLRNGGSLNYLTAGAVEVGREAKQSGVRIFVPDNGPSADSVRVTLRRPLPAKLVPLFSSGPTGTMSASAAANMRPIVSFDVGSGLGSVSSPVVSQVLGNLLNLNLGVQVLDVNGLASVNVSLGDIAAAASAGSVQDFLETQTTAPQLLSAIAGALNGTTDAAVATTLAALASGGETSHSVLPAAVLGTAAGGTADDALVSVGAVVSAVADSADSDSTLDVTLPVNVPLLGEGQVGVHLIELARPAIGPPISDAAGNPQTVANTAQGLITAAFSPRLPGNVQANVKVYAQVAAASAAVADLQCSKRGKPSSTVVIDTQTTPARFGIGEYVDLRAPEPGPVEIIKFTDTFGITAKMSIDLNQGGSQRLIFDGPFPAPPQTVGTDPGAALDGLIDAQDIEIKLTGSAPTPELALLAENVMKSLEPALKMLAKQIARDVVTPAAAVLGADLGTATVNVRSVSVEQPVVYTRGS